LRSRPAAEILNATCTRWGVKGIGVWGSKFNGSIVFADIDARRKSGRFARRPVLVGNNDNEGPMFAVESNQGGADTFFGFQCPAGHAAGARANVGVPAWRYVYAGERPSRRLDKCCPGVKGAWHGAEVALVFGTAELRAVGKDTEAETALGRKMRDAWAAFAKGSEKGLTKLGWPSYN
jgi:cholinesterase